MRPKEKKKETPTLSSHLRVVEPIDSDSHTITIQGLDFPVSMPYGAGHQCSEAEAEVLNQTRLENLRNNFAGKVKKAKAQGLTPESEAALREEFLRYERLYTFAARVGAAPQLSASQREAHKIAKGMVHEALRAKGHDPKTIPHAKMQEMVHALIARRPDITEEAERRIARARELTIEALGPDAHE